MVDVCAVWGTPATVSSGDGDFLDIDSDRAGGKYRITGSAVAVASRLDDEKRVRLTTWLVNERRQGSPRPEIDTVILDRLAEFPSLRITERFDRLLMHLERVNPVVGAHFTISDGSKQVEADRLWKGLAAWTGSSDRREVFWLVDNLKREELLDGDKHFFSMTPEGWSRLDELRLRHLPSLQGFVAMWFSDEMDAAYREGFDPGIRDCGYDPLRIDSKEHSNKIDDEIVAEIRRSRFLVADFTSERDKPRGGVYFEAGFALGLKIPVIWTCRADLIDQVHLDTRQFNHILWETSAELRKKLKNRIGAVIGMRGEPSV